MVEIRRRSNKHFFSDWSTVLRAAYLSFFVVAVLFPIDTVSAASLSAATKVSTGATSACAIVDRAAKCWGDNSYGKLGNDSTSSSTKPVTVVSKAAWVETIPASTSCFLWCTTTPEKKVAHAATGIGGKSVTKISVGTNHTCAVANARVFCWGSNEDGQLGDRNGGWLRWSTVPVAAAIDGNSALNGKEVVDVSAGDKFTCAVASDGSVACWGKGDNGRLGTNSTSGSTYPVSIYKAGAFNGQRGSSLAKASGSTMCVITTTGKPYCWGYGIDGGQSIPASSSATTNCSASSPTGRPSGTSTTTIFESKQPVAVPSAEILTAADGSDYFTGLSKSGKAYYWGMYGYRQDVTYTNVTTCRYTCRGVKVAFKDTSDSRIILAGSYPKASRSVNGSTQSGKNSSTGSSTTKTGRQVTTTHSNGSKTTYTDYGGPNNVAYNVHSYNGGTTDTTSEPINNGATATGGSCGTYTHYGFTKNIANPSVGQKVATLPQATSITSGVSVFSGNVYDDLFCAVATATTQCDGHGGNTKFGQLGNGSNSQLSNPQAVISNGWLAGKQITQLSTGSTGYTCAIANGAVGCWGINSNGQLGIGSYSNKNVPTGVVGL